jgi:flavin reductase (DIM6/NTAB) family NADH-FMN oxidoreductase RutF
MFYDALENRHGLRHDPFKALVSPRPVGWVSTLGRNGVVNLAPYSFFAAISEKPAYVMFAASGSKDTRRNAEETGEFVCSVATYALREKMNLTAARLPPESSEFIHADLTPAASHFVKPPRVAESPAALECRYWKTIELPAATPDAKPHAVIIGLVVGIHIEDDYIRDGIVITDLMRPVARLGYRDYAWIGADNMFSMASPPSPDASG